MLRLPCLLGIKRRLVSIAASAAVLAACGGGGGTSSSPTVMPQSTSGTGTSDQGSSGDAALSWTAPDENTDGTALTNLAGYRIYYGASADVMDAVIDIPSVGITTYVLDNLSAGTYYFSIRAYNSDGTESALSNIVSDTIPSS
jgi:hypothetical protein